MNEWKKIVVVVVFPSRVSSSYCALLVCCLCPNSHLPSMCGHKKNLFFFVGFDNFPTFSYFGCTYAYVFIYVRVCLFLLLLIFRFFLYFLVLMRLVKIHQLSNSQKNFTTAAAVDVGGGGGVATAYTSVLA